MNSKSTQNSYITIRATVEAMSRAGEECRVSTGDKSEAHINGKAARMVGTIVTGDGGFVCTTAAAVNRKGA